MPSFFPRFWVIVFFFLRGLRACPEGFYASTDGASCLACAPCPAPHVFEPACGPGPVPGECVSGIQVLVAINGDVVPGMNLTLGLGNWSAVPGLIQDASTIIARSRPCPAGQFRSPISRLCVACTVCHPPDNETSSCTTDSDRTCGSALVVGFRVQGASFLNPIDLIKSGVNLTNFQGLVQEDVDISVLQIPCVEGQFRSPEDQLCHACSSCLPGDIELRPCSISGDRVCSNSIQLNLDILGNTGINVQAIDLTALKARLASALAYTQLFPYQFLLPLSQSERVDIEVSLIPCPTGSFMDTGSVVCRPCTTCGLGRYEASACARDADTHCENCTVCSAFDVVLQECTRTTNRRCGGNLALQVFVANSTKLNRTGLAQDILARLIQDLPSGSVVDPEYVRHWEAIINALTGAYAGYDVDVLAINCSDDEYVDPNSNQCRTCSKCSSSGYQVQACGNTTDTVCAPCSTCTENEYEAVPCGAGDRVCYGLVSLNVTITASLVSRYNGSVLDMAYVPAMHAFLLAQTRAGTVDIRVIGSQYLNQAQTSAQPDGTLDFQLDGDYDVMTLYQLEDQPATGNRIYVHTVNITLDGLFSVQPNAALDFSVLIERALLIAESTLVQGAPEAVLGGRRLLAISPVCPFDTYLVSYPYLGQICVPCQLDPILTSTIKTPVNLRWALAEQPCPRGFARQCYGGGSQPVCISRATAVILAEATAFLTKTISCPDGQTLALDPGSGSQLCVGVQCDPGLTGPSGYCSPCPPGSYKPTTGSDACTPCPAGTFSPLPGQPALQSCQGCPSNSWSAPGSTACECNAGFTSDLNSGCSTCKLGTYKITSGPAPCIPCNPGGAGQGLISTTCAPCLQGTYASAYGLSTCISCAAGAYQYLVGSSACPMCAAGYASPPSNVRTYCEGCKSGTYSLSGAPMCLACPTGSFSFALASDCQSCPDGTGVVGATCVPCAPGSYGAAGVCVDCPTGTFTASTGVTQCETCAPGSYAPGLHYTICAPCIPGKAGLGCEPCPVGRYATGYSFKACRACDPGLYTPRRGAQSPDECQNCEEGTYWEQGDCMKCPDNTLSPRGSQSYTDCLAAPGYYGLPGVRADPCPAGSYCPRASMTPAKCPAGTYSTQASTTCVTPPGHSALRDYDWLVAGSWLAVTFFGVACLVRNKRFWKSAKRGRDRESR
jgi:hypothetical protein